MPGNGLKMLENRSSTQAMRLYGKMAELFMTMRCYLTLTLTLEITTQHIISTLAG